LPPVLREYAALDKHVILVGQGKKFELWDEQLWQSQRETWLEQQNEQDELPSELGSIAL